MSTTQTELKNQAIVAAKNGDWQKALEINLALLEHHPEDVLALNRVAIAYTQLNSINLAKETLKKILVIDKNNKIALKTLSKLDKNQGCVAPSFSRQHFIEEPGKTKTISLFRLAGKNVLEKVSIGKECELKIKNRYISAEVDGVYIGALPEDVSFRIAKLIADGNEYSCFVRSCTTNSCEVYVKETFRSEKNAQIHSFPPAKNASSFSEMDDILNLEENIPVEIVDTDNDSERSLEEMDSSDSDE